MLITYKIYVNDPNPHLVGALEKLDVSVENGSFHFEATDQEEHWPSIKRLIVEFKLNAFPITTFTREELLQAQWLCMFGSWLHGYPQPEDEFPNKTFALGFCPKCRVGLKQVLPFGMRGEPKWGRRSVMQLNWVEDEFFCKPEVWEQVFKAFGCDHRPVVKGAGAQELTTVVQLVLPQVADLDVASQGYEICSFCKQRRYFQAEGFMPRPLNPTAPAFKSSQSFGSGGESFKLVIVSNEVFAAIESAGLKGVYFMPCAD